MLNQPLNSADYVLDVLYGDLNGYFQLVHFFLDNEGQIIMPEVHMQSTTRVVFLRE